MPASRHQLIIVALALTLIGSPPGLARAGQGPIPSVPGTVDEAPFDPSTVLVKLRSHTDAPGVSDLQRAPIFGRWHEVALEPEETPEEAIARLATRPEVEVVEPNYLFLVDPADGEPLTISGSGGAEPDDPGFQYQWHFPASRVPPAWELGSGGGVAVAILDTGVTRVGEDLGCHTFVHEFNAITDTDGPGSADDDHGHGTHVAGTVAQCTDNGVGVAGIAFEATIMPIKVLDSSGAATAADIARGLEWARSHGADIINLSLGKSCASGWPACGSAIVDEAIEAAAAADIVMVGSAGNEGEATVAYPAAHPEVIAVGALDYELELAFYSNFGPDLELTAPGGDTTADLNEDGYADGILQETFGDLCGAPTLTAYCFLGGTSFAAPHVSGAAALLRSHAPGATRQAVRSALRRSALDLGPAGVDQTYGYGALQAHAALDAILPPTWPSGSSLAVENVTESAVTLSWTKATDNVGVTGYRILRDGEAIGHTTGTTFGVTGLAPATRYDFAVAAGDAVENWTTGPAATATTAGVTVILGGAAVVSDAVADGLRRHTSGVVRRISGQNRYETAAAISREAFPSKVPVAYLARGDDFPDALAGAPVAAREGGPVLLTGRDAIPTPTANELIRLSPGRIVILGGTAVVSSAVEEELGNYTSGSVTRLTGADRYATAAAVSGSHFPAGVEVTYIAAGDTFPDALAGGSVAALQGGPILLVKRDLIPGSTAEELRRLRPARIVVLGGAGVVSNEVKAALAAYTDGTVDRLAGADRYETAAVISGTTFLPGPRIAYVATGLDFPDALAGVVLAGRSEGPILLVRLDSIPSDTLDELTRLAHTKGTVD